MRDQSTLAANKPFMPVLFGGLLQLCVSRISNRARKRETVGERDKVSESG